MIKLGSPVKQQNLTLSHHCIGIASVDHPQLEFPPPLKISKIERPVISVILLATFRIARATRVQVSAILIAAIRPISVLVASSAAILIPSIRMVLRSRLETRVIWKISR